MEQAIDLLTMPVQQRAEELGRALTGAEADPEVSLTLPSTALRASKFLAFAADGGVTVAAGTSANLGPVSAFIDTLLDDVDAAAARATLDAAKTDLLKSGTSQAEVTSSQLEVLVAGVQRLLLTASLLKLVLPQIDLEVDTAGAAAGPIHTLYRAKTGTASDRVGSYRWDGMNTTPARVILGDLVAQIDDATPSSEDASLYLRLMRAGTLTDQVIFGGTGGLQMADAAGGYPGGGVHQCQRV